MDDGAALASRCSRTEDRRGFGFGVGNSDSGFCLQVAVRDGEVGFSWLGLVVLVIKFVDGCFGEGTVEMTW